MHPHKRLSARPGAALLILTLALSVWGARTEARASAVMDPDGRLVATMQGPPADESTVELTSLTLIRARYQVDVFGSAAVGRMIHEFRNDSELEILATFRLEGTSGLKVRSTRFAIDGRDGEEDARAVRERDGSGPGAPQPATGKKASANKSRRDLSRDHAVKVGPGSSVTATSEIRLDLPLEDGRFRMRLPAVFNGSEKKPAGRRGNRAFVPIEEAVRPAIGPVPMSIGLRIFNDRPLLDVASREHQILTDYEGDYTLVELSRMEVEDGRPFDLQFALGSENEVTLMAYAGAGGGDGSDVVVVLSPPTDPWRETIRAKQMIFVLDTSGSMKNDKLENAREALIAALDQLEPDDQFNIVEFDHRFSLFRPEPVTVSSVGPREAGGWLLDLRADGGTKILPGLTAALQQPESPDHHRMIVLLTDGMNTDEEEVLKALDSGLGIGRLFAVGIGRDAHSERIERMAEHGRGTAVFADNPKSIEAVVARLFSSVSAPLAWDLQIEWGGADVDSVHPERLSDLYAGRTVTAVARLIGSVPEGVMVRGQTTEGEREWTVPVRRLDEPLPESLTAGRPERTGKEADAEGASPGRKKPPTGPDKTRTRSSGSND